MKLISFFFYLTLCQIVFSQDTVHIVVDLKHPKWQISKMLTGSHFVYAFENDQLYEDERIKEWMKASGVGIIRWPGGTAVQHYHWNDLNGIPFEHDSWDTNYNIPYKDGKEFMDLDEYISFCREVGAKPMVGVNIRSGMTFDKDSLGLQEARSLIEYCVSKNYNVPYWYIGNEGYASGFGAKKYAKYLDMYASVLKSVDSTITIIGDWKFGPIRKQRFLESIEVVENSEYIDVMEYHEKWGVIWGLESGITYDDWKSQFPIYNGKLTEYIGRFNMLKEDMMKSHVKIGFNEWGLGDVKGADEYGHALIASDYLIELFRNDVFQACYWNLNMGARKSRILETSKNRKSLIEFNPVAKVFELFAPAQGKQLLHIECASKSLYGFGTLDLDGTISIFLLNKSENNRTLRLDGLKTTESIALATLIDPGIIKNQVISSPNKIVLEPWTLNRITFFDLNK